MKRAIQAAMAVLAVLAGLACTSAPVTASAATKPVAVWRGAHAVTNSAANWTAANAAIGPLKTQRLFYVDLPATYQADGGDCSSLPAGVMCIVSYQTPTTNVLSYVNSIPADRPVTMLWVHEPEGNTSTGAPKFTSGAAFVAGFKAQSKLIRSAKRPNVQVASASEMDTYAVGGRGYSCSYIPPASSVDHYYVDAYDPDGTLLKNDPRMLRWMACTVNRGPTRGLTEWGVGPSSCITSGLSRSQVMAKDLTWFRTAFPKMYLLEYWWVDNSATTGKPCKDWQFTTSEAGPWTAAMAGH